MGCVLKLKSQVSALGEKKKTFLFWEKRLLLGRCPGSDRSTRGLHFDIFVGNGEGRRSSNWLCQSVL